MLSPAPHARAVSGVDMCFAHKIDRFLPLAVSGENTWRGAVDDPV